jgi:hypothetical protein
MPNNKMERFTQRARRVLSLAQESAEKLKHNYIGTEHLLLALFREEEGVAGRVLRDLGIQQRRIEDLIEELTGTTESKPKVALDLSPGTKRVLELGVDEARKLGHHYIGTEHLLLGLVRQSESVAIEILIRCGVSTAEVRRLTLQILKESPVQAEYPPESKAEPRPQVPSLEPLRRQELPRLPHVVQSQTFQVLTAAITRILDMVEANKLTSAQAAELLAGLQPYLAPSTSESALLIAQSLGATLPQERMLRLIIRDSASGAIKLEVVLPLVETLESLDSLVSAAASDYVGWLWMTDMDDKNRIEVRVEAQKDDEPPAPEIDDAQ